MPLWLEIVVPMLATYAGGLALGWVLFARKG